MKQLLLAAALVIATSAHANEVIKQRTIGLHGNCADTIYGTSGADNIDESANSCDLTIFGLGGDDTIISGSGNDFIYGGAGADTLTGNGGVNTYVYTAISDSPTSGNDYIYGFNEASDVIDVSAICPNTTLGCIFIGKGTAFTDVPGQIRYQWRTAFKNGHDVNVTWIEGDFDGDGTAEFLVSLDGWHTLTLSNFDF